jgi:hypothetical protein
MSEPIPSHVEQLYEFLKTEVQWLHARWVIFEQLYSKGALRLDLLNEAAPSFFHMLQLMMYDDMQMGLARLTDPAPNKASLLQLQKRLESHANAKLAVNTKIVLDELMRLVQPIREHRNQLLAHYSLDHAIEKAVAKLPDVYYQDILASLALVRDYMNLIEFHYHDCHQGYEHFVWQDDGDSLVTLLRWALRHREELMSAEIAFEPKDKWSDA